VARRPDPRAAPTIALVIKPGRFPWRDSIVAIQTPDRRFATIPIGGYRPAVARHGTRGITEAGRDPIEGPVPEIRRGCRAKV